MFDIIYRFDPSRRQSRRLPTNADEARRTLEQGSEEFASLGAGAAGEGCDTSRVIYFNLADVGVDPQQDVPKQEPFAAVLGCSDARVPMELVFDRACNELFVVRVAGNVLGREELGSLDYAVEYLGESLKLLVVLGHSRCGAVTAAVDTYLRPGDYLGLASNHPLRAIVDSIFPAVRGADRILSEVWGEDVRLRPGYRSALVETAIVVNAALTASALREEFTAEGRPHPAVVYGVYDLALRRVHVPLEGEAAPAPPARLAEPPRTLDDFRELGRQVATSAHLRKILGV
jgi:carbonic anhydrase